MVSAGAPRPPASCWLCPGGSHGPPGGTAAEPGPGLRFMLWGGGGVRETSMRCFPRCMSGGNSTAEWRAQPKPPLPTTHSFLKPKSHIPRTWGETERQRLIWPKKQTSFFNKRTAKRRKRQRWNLKIKRLKRHINSQCKGLFWSLMKNKSFIRKLEH